MMTRAPIPIGWKPFRKNLLCHITTIFRLAAELKKHVQRQPELPEKEGIILQSDLERVIGRISAEHHALNDRLTLGLNIMSSNSKASNVPLQNMVFQQAVKYNPMSPVYNEDGTFFENFNNTQYFNPVSIIKNAVDDTKYGSLQGNFTLEAKLPFNLTYNANLSYQRGTWLHGEYYNSYYSNNYSTGSFYTNGDPGGGRSLRNFYSNGLAYRNYYQNTSKTFETFLTWGKKFGLHNLKAVLGYSWQKNTNNDGLQTSQTNFVNDYILPITILAWVTTKR